MCVFFLKIRGKYFDRIERAEVATLLASIYANVESLEDIQFLVKYAANVLPPDPQDANGPSIWRNIVNLQQDLTEQREVFYIRRRCKTVLFLVAF